MSAAEPIRVLIAEDVPTDAELSVRELKRAGLRVVHRIEDTEAGFRGAVAEFAPQIILSDFTMPRFDGMRALDLARELVPDTPFIFVSGTLGEEYAIRALKNGATDYVLKTNLIRLPAAVERALAEAQARAERRRTEAALAETRARLASIMETLPDVLWSATLDGERLHYVSPAARQVLGHDASALESSPGLWFEVIHPKDKPAVLAALRAATTGESFDIEYRIVRPDGSVRWLNVRGRLVRGADGAPQRIDGIARDMTEQVAQRKRVARLARIRELTSAVNAAIVRTRDRGELFEDFCCIAVEQGGFQGAQVAMFEKNGGQLRMPVVPKESADALVRVVEEYNQDPAGAKTLLAECLRTGRAVVSNDAATDPRILQKELYARHGVRALACLPLAVAGQVLGVLVLRGTERDSFDEEELRLLEELSANLSFALELMDKQKQLDYLAYFDPLTDLPNRAQLRQRITHAIDAARAAGRKAALVTLDIDRFRTINDAFGQAAGDQILQHIARLAARTLGEHEHVARVGGNQFAVLFPLLREAGDLGRTLERMAASLLDAMVEVQGREIRVAAKAGAAIFPDDGADAETLMANAEAAMKRAKTTGERYLFYTPSINARVAERLDLEAKVRRAAERGEFKLAYQPKVDLGSGRIAGMEALLRWRNGGGEMSPAQFVPVLEETGLISAVGQRAMREAVAVYRAWRARGLAAPRIAVNVSALQLRSRNFVDEVRAVLEGAAGEDCGLDLEITESLLMENMDESLEKLRTLRESGVHIALDDFGTGYSSLAYLGRLPIDTLKIDRAFVRDMTEGPEGTTMVSAMISLAHALELKVVAEGVETEAQAQLLRLLRCDQIQGYLFSRPLPADAAAELLASHGYASVSAVGANAH
jgi:diguanylate cyclase (GGDEF)-like protein/PAS domain S-box-containing protein